jgi:O-Antigen ligase
MLFGLLAISVAGIAAFSPCLPLKVIGPQSINRVRDWWLLGMLALATLAAARYAPPFAPLGLWLGYWWWHPPTQRQPRDLVPTILVWLALGAYWAALRMLPPLAWTWLPWVWVGIASVGVLWISYDWYWVGRYLPDELKPPGFPKYAWYRPYRPLHRGAWLGQRTFIAMLFALTLPFFPLWALWVPIVGLVVTSSWLAVLAALGAGVVLWPPVIWPGTGLIAVSAAMSYTRPQWLNWTPRGGSLDSVGHRFMMWKLITPWLLHRAWVPWGYGPRSLDAIVKRWAALYGPERVPMGHAHNEMLQFLFETGPCGLAALAWLGWLVLPHLRWGDPWSAAWVAGVILAGGSIPLRLMPLGVLWLTVTAKVAG